MAKVRNDQVLAAALALLLTTAGTALATPENSDANADASVTATVASAQPSDAELNSRIPLPDPLDVPPPSASDVAAPVPQLERKNTPELATPAQPAEAPASQPVVTTSVPQPAVPEPAVTTSVPEPAVPEPAVTASVPDPAVTSGPEPVVTSAPQPAVTSAPEPAVTSAPQPATTDTATAPAAVEAPADPFATKLKEVITTKLSRFVDRKDDRPGVESFYAARQYAPLWTDQGVLNARGKAVIAYLTGVSAEGLDPSDYPAPAFKAGTDPQALAEAELKLVDSVVTFARHAQNGRVHFSRVAADISYNLVPPDPAQVLAKLAEASDAKSLDSYAPQHAAYKALKAKLAELRGQTAEPAAAPAPQVVRIPEGSILRFGDDDRRVPFLRKRLEMADQSSTKYDKQVVEAVKEFQDKAGLDDDGSVGPTTLRALNGGSVAAAKPRGRNDSISIILANMERWRWLPRELGKAHVVLNVPSYTLKVVNDGAKIWETRVVVGKPHTATPLLSETMKFITVNPTWNVPPSIVYGEYLPVLYQDPTAISRLGLKVTQNNDGTVHMYQPPGDGNALGRIRFNFPNKFLVYQHDTPDKHLFARDTRAYSHGCMRVQDPLKYGEVLLSIALPEQKYTVAKLRSMYGPEERDIQFPKPIPVHITYQTAYVEDGKLVLRDDIYGRDAKVLALLRGEDRRIADIPMDRRAEQNASYQRTPVNLPYGLAEGQSSRYASRDAGGGFFGMLFGGGPRYYQEQRPPAQVERRRTNSRPLN
jgi:murein L,D-transpeptidase YcbB/YkuD